MKLKSITPIRVTDAELARRQLRYTELAPAGIDIDLINLPDGDGVPDRFETAADIAASERLVAAEIQRTDPADYDAVMPDCVLDPGVATTAGTAPVPVYGMLQLSAGFLETVVHRFAAMTRNEAIAEELRACLRRYGLDNRFDDVAVLNLAFNDIEDDVTWNAAVDGVRDRYAERGVPSILNGCSAVAVHGGGAGVAVVDPTRLALRVLGLAADSGLVPGVKNTAASHAG